MKYDPQKHHRRSIRLKGYDYAQPGAYFVTICTQEHACVLGEIVEGEMRLSSVGQVAHNFWSQVGNHFPDVEVVPFVVMPNHVHAIITIRETDVGQGGGTPPLPDTPRRGVVSTPEAPGAGVTQDGGLVQGEGVDQGGGTPPLPDLGQIVAYYKYQTTKWFNAQHNEPGARFWQRNYYEHIVRNDEEFQQIYAYIQTNPLHWLEDQLHPAAAPNRFNQD